MLKFFKTAKNEELKKVLVDSDGATSDDEVIPRILETTGASFDEYDYFVLEPVEKKRLTWGRRSKAKEYSGTITTDEESEMSPAPPTKEKGKALKKRRKLILFETDNTENA